MGDPACDVMVAWTLFSGESRDVFRATLAVDDAIWARGRGWALSWALIFIPYGLVAGANRVAVDAFGGHAFPPPALRRLVDAENQRTGWVEGRHQEAEQDPTGHKAGLLRAIQDAATEQWHERRQQV